MTVIVVGPVMLVAYLFLLKLFRVSELRDLLRPLLGRLGRGAGPDRTGPGTPPSSGSEGAAPGTERTTPERATVSVDTGLIPRISGEFDAVSFRAGPVPEAGTGTLAGSRASRGRRRQVRRRLPPRRGRARHRTGRPAPR